MDLGAYEQIEDLEALAKANGIDIPRLRGYRLMKDEEPVSKEELDEKFVRKILEVRKVILNNKTYEYIDVDETNYVNHILVCQLLYNMNWIDWGGGDFDTWCMVRFEYL